MHAELLSRVHCRTSLQIITAAADMDKSSYVDKMMPCMAAFGAKARHAGLAALGTVAQSPSGNRCPELAWR